LLLVPPRLLFYSCLACRLLQSCGYTRAVKTLAPQLQASFTEQHAALK
jgi:hypothetical protein